MNAYLATIGILFALLTVLHAWRLRRAQPRA